MFFILNEFFTPFFKDSFILFYIIIIIHIPFSLFVKSKFYVS